MKNRLKKVFDVFMAAALLSGFAVTMPAVVEAASVTEYVAYDFEDASQLNAWNFQKTDMATNPITVDGTLTTVTENGNTFARITPTAQGSETNLMVAGLDFSSSPVKRPAANGYTIISVKIRTNCVTDGSFRKGIVFNYSQENARARALQNANSLGTIDGNYYYVTPALNYYDWINNNFQTNQWYTAKIYLESNGTNYSRIGYKLIDSNGNDIAAAAKYADIENNVISYTNALRSNDGNTENQDVTLNKLGFQLYRNALTLPEGGVTFDFDDLRVFNNEASLVKSTFKGSVDQFQIQLGGEPDADYQSSIMVTDPKGHDVTVSTSFDKATGILTLTPGASLTTAGTYTIALGSGMTIYGEPLGNSTLSAEVVQTSTEDVFCNFEDGLGSWTLGSHTGDVTLTNETDNGNKFARVTVKAGSAYADADPSSNVPDAKLDLANQYELHPQQTIIISADVRSSDINTFRKCLMINHTGENVGWNLDTAWSWDGTDLYNYSFNAPGTIGENGYGVPTAWSQADARKVYGPLAANQWYTIKMVYDTDDNALIYHSRVYLYDGNGDVIACTDDSTTDSSSLRKTNLISTIGFEMRRFGGTLATDSIFDFDNFRIATAPSDGAKVVDANKSIVNSVSNGTYYGKFTCFNDNTETADLTGIIAVYDKGTNGTLTLKNIKLAKTSEIKQGSEKVFYTLDGVDAVSGQVIKTFLWNSQNSNPVCDNGTIN